MIGTGLKLLATIALGATVASAQTAEQIEAARQPGFYFVPRGALLQKKDAREYCENTHNSRLPTPDEAKAIYYASLDPDTGRTTLERFLPLGYVRQPGSFYTSATKGIFHCSVALMVREPTPDDQRPFTIECDSDAHLVVCVSK